MKYQWLANSTNLADRNLDPDHALVIDLIGVSNYIKLFENFEKTGLYFSCKSIEGLMENYILSNKHIAPKILAREMGVSVRYIYKIINKKERKSHV